MKKIERENFVKFKYVKCECVENGWRNEVEDDIDIEVFGGLKSKEDWNRFSGR